MSSGKAALDEATALVLDTLRHLLAEVDPTRARAAIGPDQSLTRELALGSLERVELAMRLEKAAGVELGETVLAEADTPRQIAAAIARAQAGPRPGLPPANARPSPDLGPASARPAPGLPPASAHPPPGLGPASARPGPGRGPATAARTLVEALRWQVERGADRVHIQLRNDDGSETLITYGSL